jgi:hypothetical protein
MKRLNGITSTYTTEIVKNSTSNMEVRLGKKIKVMTEKVTKNIAEEMRLVIRDEI